MLKIFSFKNISVLVISIVLLLVTIQKLQARAASPTVRTIAGAQCRDHAKGVEILSVDSSERAYRFGLQKGDIVLKINGQTVKNTSSFLELLSSISQGAAISIQVIRNNVETTVGRTASGMGGGMGGIGGRGGMGGGRGGMGGQTREILKNYDKNGDGWLNNNERKSARGLPITYTGIKPVQYGITLRPDGVMNFSDKEPLYNTNIIRTLFLEFENPDWEQELEFFFHTDVEVPAKLMVDGKTYENIGVRFRGNTSYSMSRTGYKRPLNITMDLVNKEQNLYGYHTLNLMNSIHDATFLRQILFHKIAREYMPALKANFVRLVINGENWGIYINLQQFNTDFIKDEFDTRKGERWKAPFGRGGVGLSYLGDNISSYKNSYEIKSKDDPNSWINLINLCKVLNQTPIDQLEKALKPILDINDALKFLALDNISANGDGYWTRAADYLIYRDKKGLFHFFAYDTLETFGAEIGGRGGGRGGMGGRGSMGSGKTMLNPLSGSGALYRLLSVPHLKQLYLGYVRDIAEKWLDWDKISPLVYEYQELISVDVQVDARNTNTVDAFFNDVETGSSSIKSFMTQRRQYLLGLQQVKEAPLPVAVKSSEK
jgi:hypothetical protein